MPIFSLVSLGSLWYLVGVTYASLIAVQPLPLAWKILFCLSAFLVSGTYKKASFTRTCSLCLLCLLFGACFTMQWRANYFTKYNPSHVQHFKAIVVDPPDVRDTKTLLTVLPNQAFGTGISGQPMQTPLRIHAGRYPIFHYGDELEITGQVSPPDSFNGFNYPLFLERYHIYGEVLKPRFVKIINHNKGSPLMSWLYNLRSNTEAYIQTTLPDPEASFLGGILLGEKRSIPVDIQEALQNTGTVHIIVISGSNITVMLEILLYFLPFSKKKSQFYATVIISLFIIIPFLINSIFFIDDCSSFLYWIFDVSPHICNHKTSKDKYKILFFSLIDISSTIFWI